MPPLRALRRGLAGAPRRVLAAFACVLAGAAAAQTPPRAGAEYPSRPIRYIVPFAPGGGTDIVARAIAARLAERWGQQVVVDNRGGGGTVIGTELAVKAPADGYTLLQGTASLTINPSLRRALPYDALRDLTPVTQAAVQPYVLAVHPGLAAGSVVEYAALARAKPGQITYGTPGAGSGGHLAGELFALLAGVSLLHVPYKGSGPALTDLLGGQINSIFVPILAVLPQVRAGKLRALATSGTRRAAVMPETPTVAEAGVPGYEAVSWSGVLVPAGTPRPVVARLHEAVVQALATSEVKARLAGDGAEAVGGSPEQFAALLRAEMTKWAKVVKAAGLRAE